MKIEDFNPRLQAQIRAQLLGSSTKTDENPIVAGASSSAIRDRARPLLLNKTETRFRDILRARGHKMILEQAVTLRMGKPFKSYRPDLAVFDLAGKLVFFEVKGPHRFREKGIAKVALVARCYPQFTFILADWTKSGWKESVLTP